MPAIRYVPRHAIDDVKWNACIDNASNGLIYAYTFYLDNMCPNWGGLVLDDYAAVMPLPWRKKWGIAYLYQPFAIAQSGLFGNNLSADLLYEVLKNIPATFRYWDMNLNFGNLFDVPPFVVQKRNNFILPLNKPYETVQQQYRQHIKRNIKKAVAKNCVVQKNIEVDHVIALAKKHEASWGTEQDFEHFKKLYLWLFEKGQAVTYAVVETSGAILASAVFFYSNNRAYYILPGNAFTGRSAGASHFLIDHFIKDHAGQNRILDFEGSDVPNLQFFYTSFGAVNEPYAAIRHNRLPWYLKWLKR